MMHHYYHVYADGQWRDPLREHVEALNSSDLVSRLNGISIGIVGSPDNREQVRRVLQAKGLHESVVVEADEGWEQVTLNHMLDFVKGIDRPSGWVFYAHTKGAANPTHINIAWRKSMTYHNMIRFDNVEQHFNNMEVDAIGCHWVNDAIFGGNYWWARVPYLATLQPPLEDNRWRAEEWLGSGKPRIIDINPGWPAHERFTVEW